MNANSTIKFLRKIRLLIQNEDRWLRNYFILDRRFEEVLPGDRQAYKFSLLGAIYQVLSNKNSYTKEMRYYITCMLTKAAGKDLFDYNNHPHITHANILYLIDNTIYRLKTANKQI